MLRAAGGLSSIPCGSRCAAVAGVLPVRGSSSHMLVAVLANMMARARLQSLMWSGAHGLWLWLWLTG
jgi:hypothetical protein